MTGVWWRLRFAVWWLWLTGWEDFWTAYALAGECWTLANADLYAFGGPDSGWEIETPHEAVLTELSYWAD
jgi:hypothetical protein